MENHKTVKDEHMIGETPERRRVPVDHRQCNDEDKQFDAQTIRRRVLESSPRF